MKFKKVIDLSISVNNQTPVYPGDSKPNIYPIAEHNKEGYQVTQVNIGAHTGTTQSPTSYLLNTTNFISVISSTAYLIPSLPVPLSFTPPYGMLSTRNVGISLISTPPT
jgi:kynurenine formamidase